MAIQSWQKGFFTNGPYNDTWDPTKNYISLGFAPGYALQSKELLELQSTILNQISTAARSMFKHGQPRIDLEEESLLASSTLTNPVTVNAGEFTFKRNSQFFTNFRLNDSNDFLPNGFWVNFPPTHTDSFGTQWKETIDPAEGDFVGFTVEIKTIDWEDDDTLLDTAGGFSNLNALGATRYAYSVVNHGADDEPSYLIVKDGRRPGAFPLDPPNIAGNQFFIPIAKYINSTYLWAFDEVSAIPAP